MTLSIEEGYEAVWSKGCLHYLLYPDMQLRLYRATKAWKDENPNSAKPFVWNLHRAAGKTFELVLMCWERALGTPGQEVRFAASTTEQCKEIVEPNWRKLYDMCPPSLRPTVREGGELLIFQNPYWPVGSSPSRIHFIGCRERADSHRGKRSNMIVIDECRDVPDFQYVAKTVFGPHFSKMWNPVYLMSSTPPESMDHEFISVYCEHAGRDGRYFLGPASEDLDWTADDDERMLELFHSKDSPEWLREMECRTISDPERLIVREFSEARHVVPTWDRPKDFIPLTFADGGFVDFFGVAFGYVDFDRAKLVIEDSLAIKGQNTFEIARQIKEREVALWGEPVVEGNTPSMKLRVKPRRHADMTPQQLADLAQLCALPFWPADRRNAMNYSDPDSQINVLRGNFAREKIVLLGNGRNAELIRQLKNGIRDKNGKIPRSQTLGHCDVLMALVYGNKIAPWNTMPPSEPQPIDREKVQVSRWAEREAPRVATRALLRGSLRRRFQ